VREFLERLRSENKKIPVGIVLRDGVLRNLVRIDLERNGFDVVAVSSRPEPMNGSDVVVTEFAGPKGRLLTVRLGAECGTSGIEPVLCLSPEKLDRLPEVLRHELLERRVP
jgi:hypothetical protein